MTRDLKTNLAKALAHPTRQQILVTMSKSKHTPISPRELADRLSMPLSDIGYHIRVLAANSLIELVKEVPVGGALQHFYKLTLEEPWALRMLGIDEEPGPD